MKWFNQYSTDNLSEDQLNTLFDNIQHKVNENYFDNHYPELFTKGFADYNGMLFYPTIKKFLITFVGTHELLVNERKFMIRFAKDLESAYENIVEELGHCFHNNFEVIEYPFKS